jgi:nucleotide-binding universal stress UspA family protein
MRLLIATDGSDIAREAARHALAVLAEPSEVTVLHVIAEAPGEDGGGIEGPTEGAEAVKRHWQQLDNEADRALNDVASLMPKVDVQRRVEIGNPGAVICAIAKEIEADVLVIGSHGHGVLKQLVLGSVSSYIVHHATCALLVVRHPA